MGFLGPPEQQKLGRANPTISISHSHSHYGWGFTGLVELLMPVKIIQMSEFYIKNSEILN